MSYYISTKTTRFMEYKYFLNRLGKMFTFSNSPKLYISTLKALVIQKQEQTHLFLEFKAFSFTYYHFHLKLLILSLKSL
jgi:hypothetical protein